MEIENLLIRARQIWPKKMKLGEIIVALGVVYGDICRVQRNAFKDQKKDQEKELKKELGNIIFSTIRWCDDLGYDPKECISLAIKSQEKFNRAQRPKI